MSNGRNLPTDIVCLDLYRMKTTFSRYKVHNKVGFGRMWVRPRVYGRFSLPGGPVEGVGEGHRQGFRRDPDGVTDWETYHPEEYDLRTRTGTTV